MSAATSPNPHTPQHASRNTTTNPPTTKTNVSQSLLGDEWLERKQTRTAELKKHLEKQQSAELTFTPKISKYDRSDRPDDVLESMAQKDKKAEARLKAVTKSLEGQRKAAENATFSPNINGKSQSILDDSKYHHDSIQRRMSKKADESNLKLAATRYEVTNFDQKTGQKLFQPIVNHQHLQKTSTTSATNKDSNNWRTTKGNLTLGTSDYPPSSLDLDQEEGSTSTINDILGKREMSISDALYNDAFDRRERQTKMNNWVHLKEDKTAHLSSITHRSQEHIEKTNALAERKRERDILAAFSIMSSAKTEYGEEELLSEDDCMRMLKLFRENNLIDRGVMMKDVDDDEGENNSNSDSAETDMVGGAGGSMGRSMAGGGSLGGSGEISRETASSIFRVFAKEAEGDSKKVTREVFLKVAKVCCASALSTGITVHDNKQPQKIASSSNPPNESTDGDDNNHSFMYPAHQRGSVVANNFGFDLSSLQNLPSSPSSSSTNYPTTVINFCRASIRYVALKKAEEVRKRERDDEVDHPYNPQLCQRSLKLDKEASSSNINGGGGKGGFEERLVKMEVKKRMVDKKVNDKRADLARKDIEGCTFSPKITRFKFRKNASEEMGDDVEGGDGDGEGEGALALPKPGHVLVRAVKFTDIYDDDNHNNSNKYGNSNDDDDNIPIVGRARTSSTSSNSIRGWDGPVEVTDYLSKPAHQRLYERRPHPDSKKKLRETEADTLEKKDLAECTFKPKINTPLKGRKTRRDTWFGYTESESPKAGWGILEEKKKKPVNKPKGYEKAIEKARKIKEMREKKNEWHENGGYTEESYKKSQKLRASGTAAFSFGEGGGKVRQQKRREPKFFMDVKLAGGKKGRIGICEGDDAREVAKGFAKTYTLGKGMEEKLVALIESNMAVNGVGAGKKGAVGEGEQ